MLPLDHHVFKVSQYFPNALYKNMLICETKLTILESGHVVNLAKPVFIQGTAGTRQLIIHHENRLTRSSVY